MKALAALILLVAAPTFGAVNDSTLTDFVRQSQQQLQQFQDQSRQQTQAFIDKANRDYANYLAQSWKQYEALAPVVKLDQPKPNLQPREAAPEEEAPPLLPSPVQPTPRPERPSTLDYPKPKPSLGLKSTKEKDVAALYRTLAATDYRATLTEINAESERMGLNDWGKLQLILNHSHQETSDPNAATVIQSFLLDQLGLKNKIARTAEGGLELLFAPDCMVYGRYFVEYEGDKYFMAEKKPLGSFYACPKQSANAQRVMKMKMEQMPEFTGPGRKSSHISERYHVKVEAEVPDKLVEFLSTYPQCDISVYAWSPPSAGLAQAIDMQLGPAIEGKSHLEAANILLNFVQTGFDYATDREQFGYEKPFFVDELFYYPQCDCEDRSVLFAYLVRHLLGLEVVLLNYPSHVATAVKFPEPVPGDMINVPGHGGYTVCDPTFINATVGRTMSRFQQVTPTVVM